MIPVSDRIHRMPDRIANIEALRDIFLVNERAMFEWIVSRGIRILTPIKHWEMLRPWATLWR